MSVLAFPENQNFMPPWLMLPLNLLFKVKQDQ